MPGHRNSSLPPLDDSATLCFTEYNSSSPISCVRRTISAEFAPRASLGAKTHSKQDDSLEGVRILLGEYGVIIALGFEVSHTRISVGS